MLLHITMSYDQHACNIIHVKISRYIEKEHKDHYHYIFIKKKRKKKKHNSHFNENPNIVEIKRTRAAHSTHEEHTQSSILYPKFPVLLWQKIEPLNFIRIMKTKAI